MKILYYVTVSNSFMGKWQKSQIYDELEHYDIHFEVFNPWEYADYEEANQKLVERLKSDKSIDLFMSCLSSEMLFEETMSEIKILPIPKLLICYDNLQAPYMHQKIAPYFDLVWLTSYETEHMFKKWGSNTIFMPYASNPFAFHTMYENSIDRVCFVGTPYGTRSLMFNTLTQGGVGVDTFCKEVNMGTNIEENTHAKDKENNAIKVISEYLSFPIGRKVLYSKIKKSIVGTPTLQESDNLRLLRKLSNEEMNKAYSNYALSLNVITLRNTAVLKNPVHKLHLRTFEIPMCAGLELVEYNEELARYFSEDEIVFYKDKEEMVDKARFYTNPKNENIVQDMKFRARKRAATEHCWMNRFSAAFDKLGLKYNNIPDTNINI